MLCSICRWPILDGDCIWSESHSGHTRILFATLKVLSLRRPLLSNIDVCFKYVARVRGGSQMWEWMISVLGGSVHLSRAKLDIFGVWQMPNECRALIIFRQKMTKRSQLFLTFAIHLTMRDYKHVFCIETRPVSEDWWTNSLSWCPRVLGWGGAKICRQG